MVASWVRWSLAPTWPVHDVVDPRSAGARALPEPATVSSQPPGDLLARGGVWRWLPGPGLLYQAAERDAGRLR